MSEDEDKVFDEESKKKEKELRVTIQSEDPKTEQLENELKSEKEKRADIEAQLEIVAEKEFTKAKADTITRGKKVGITINPEDIEGPEKLQAYGKIIKQKELEEKEEKAHRTPATGTALTSEQYGFEGDQSGKPLSERTYKTEAELIRDLETERSKGDKEAEKVLSKLTKKALKKEVDIEYEGEISKAYSLSNQKSKDKETQKEIDEKARKEREKWRSVE